MTHARIGIPTGHIQAEAIRIYQKIFTTLSAPKTGERFIPLISSVEFTADFYILSPHDLSTAVARKQLDLAITGSDILDEQRDNPTLQDVGALPVQSSLLWHIALIGKPNWDKGNIVSEYPNITRRHFPNARIQGVRGSAEGWSILLKSPAVTVTHTGNTIKRNKLEKLEVLETSQPVLIYNPGNLACNRLLELLSS
ncbi:MAG: hypothetical protein JNK33_04065 [Candidatus Doudnabacteria bacterium]|nr:hypothetical protein [Candidatus Doudnabacteria bacterium]